MRDLAPHIYGDDWDDTRPREARPDQREPLTPFERQRAAEAEKYHRALNAEERDHADTRSDLALERRLNRAMAERIGDAVACLEEGRADDALRALTAPDATAASLDTMAPLFAALGRA